MGKLLIIFWHLWIKVVLPECTPRMKRPAMTIIGFLHHLLKPIKDPPTNTSMVDRTSVPFLCEHMNSLHLSFLKDSAVSRGKSLVLEKAYRTPTLTFHIWWRVCQPVRHRSSHRWQRWTQWGSIRQSENVYLEPTHDDESVSRCRTLWWTGGRDHFFILTLSTLHKRWALILNHCFVKQKTKKSSGTNFHLVD